MLYNYASDPILKRHENIKTYISLRTSDLARPISYTIPTCHNCFKKWLQIPLKVHLPRKKLKEFSPKGLW